MKYTYETELVAKAKDIAYQIIKLRKKDAEEECIEELLLQIKDILSGVHYFLEQQFLKDGIDKIFEEAKNI